MMGVRIVIHRKKLDPPADFIDGKTGKFKTINRYVLLNKSLNPVLQPLNLHCLRAKTLSQIGKRKKPNDRVYSN